MAWFLVGVDGAPKTPIRIASDIRHPPVGRLTIERRTRLLKLFRSWLATQIPEPLEKVAKGPDLFSELISAYGYAAFESLWPRNDLVDTLLAISDLLPWARATITSGWRVVTRWRELEPSTPHTPLPEGILRALCVVFIAWGWWRLLVIIWLSFYGLLRPGESCILGHGDLLIDKKGILVRIRNPKRRAGMARQQYSRIDAVDARPIFLKIIEGLKPGEQLWPGSQGALTRRFRAGLARLVPHPQRFSLGSLRSGGATVLFQRLEENVPKLQWRGRWQHLQTLVHYVQELAASAIGLRWAPATQQRIEQLSSLFDAILAEATLEIP